MLFIPIIFFIFGLAIGSFLNVLVLRLNTGVSMRGRSRCFSCLEKLGWYDLVPLVSFFAIRGHCRYCKSRVSLQYPIVELASGLIFGSVAYIAGPLAISIPDGVMVFSASESARYMIASTFFVLLLAISTYDIRHKIIPDSLSLTLFGAAVLNELFSLYRFFDSETLKLDLISAVGAFAFFWGLWFLSRGRWMGFGDAKIALSIGLFLGYPWTIIAILFAFWTGAFFGIAMLAMGKYTRKSEVPFAPFLALGAYFAYVFAASDLLLWYYRYIGF